MVYHNSLEEWPDVSKFLGVIDLKCGALIVAVLGIVHPVAYCCTCFIPLSYLLVSIWILVALYFAASILLLYGLVQENAIICIAWIVFMLLFVLLMMVMLTLLTLAFLLRRRIHRVFLTLLGMLYYILTIYFILVVNSYRKTLKQTTLNVEQTATEPFTGGQRI